MDEFTVKEKYVNQSVEMKSRFIAILFPLNDDTVFKTELKNIMKEHPKAKHYVYAYRVGQKCKSCDDKEPKGTGGRPILEFLMKKNLNYVAIVVVRYYGGVNLGASRLLRTYLNSAINVTNNANLIKI